MNADLLRLLVFLLLAVVIVAGVETFVFAE